MADLSGDLSHGPYTATGTVYSDRRNLFDLRPGHEHHIGTLVSGSKSKLQRLDEDCDKIVRGLSLLDVNEQMLVALKLARERLAISNCEGEEDEYLSTIDAAIAAAEGHA